MRHLLAEGLDTGGKPEALRLVRQHTITQLAIGEVFNTGWYFQVLIKEQLIDDVRAASTHFGRITPLKKVMDYAAQFHIKSDSMGRRASRWSDWRCNFM